MTSAFKSKLRANALTSLVNPDYPSGGLVHFMGTLKIDAVMIDCEQGSPSFENVEEMARAARLHGVSAIVRIPSTEPWTVERYMMRGVDGLVVPRLDTAAQVQQLVHDMRYSSPKDFDQKVLIVQVESISAVDELDGFLDVQEIDCYFIGVVDLAKSMGFAGDYTQPQVTQVVDRTIERILAAGRAVGIMVKDHDIASWRGKGVSMLYTHLNDFAMMGAQQWHGLAAGETTSRKPT